MREYVEPIYGWHDDVQRAYHEDWFDPERLSIIEDDDGRTVGVLDVIDEGDHLYLSRIEILPEAQGQGLGTSVVEGLLRQGRVVRSDVFSNNVRARRFYERLGFGMADRGARSDRIAMSHKGWTRAER